MSFYSISLDHLATLSFKKSLKGLSGIWWILGRLPFVITAWPGWSFRKWNARVLRTEKTCSGQTGSAHEVGSLSSPGPARNARSGGRVGLVVRTLAFHQCGPSSISAPGVICWLSLLVLYSAMRGFPPGTPVFPSHQKPTFDLICEFSEGH